MLAFVYPSSEPNRKITERQAMAAHPPFQERNPLHFIASFSGLLSVFEAHELPGNGH